MDAVDEGFAGTGRMEACKRWSARHRLGQLRCDWLRTGSWLDDRLLDRGLGRSRTEEGMEGYGSLLLELGSYLVRDFHDVLGLHGQIQLLDHDTSKLLGGNDGLPKIPKEEVA